MDQKEAMETLAWVLDNWNRVEKNEVLLAGFEEGERAVAIFFTHSHFQISFFVFIGPKFGLSERCCIVDTDHKGSESDSLLVASTVPYMVGGKTFLDLTPDVLEAKKTAKKLKSFKILQDAVVHFLQEQLDFLMKNPSFCSELIQNKIFYDKAFSQSSVYTVRYTSKRT